MSELVECRSESAYAEKPVALTWENQRLEIVEILARWRTPNAACFRVRIRDGQTLELAYSETDDKWQIKQF